MKEVIERARTAVKPATTEPLPMEYRTTIVEPTPWDRRVIESKLNVKLPEPLVQLWNEASSLRLFEDVAYGQWGLVLLPPEEVVEATLFQRSSRADQLIEGDLLLGEFLGDSDLLLLRADPRCADFGSVMVDLPIYSRAEWPLVGASLDMFLNRYLETLGDKFWDTGAAADVD